MGAEPQYALAAVGRQPFQLGQQPAAEAESPRVRRDPQVPQLADAAAQVADRAAASRPVLVVGEGEDAGGATNDPYNLLVDSFSTWWMTVIYLVAMVALGMHLHHGTWSSLQTLGLTNSPRARTAAKRAGWVVALVVAGGFALVPLFTLFGVISK